ncbi:MULTISPECIES: TnsA endonuclease N-terminal domain-containing protein [Paraburkholderia]|uniref:TnsA endonuclease N-terminal domain-containing protein n=1 Tax=Paraburkholderia TaxID=1822464 RepID=UPI00225AA3D8|nr:MULTISPECIES: TnsA endonuclease N-terminal domain-containing protein [Paraburkholderia]MCX4173717.1 TnsA endonuclease N-terminal domain-containing protein [Paraburkholderia madseniana]MDQ6461722.1 TnsA endonuclease N-terminal domain-containing protein [Paraburkholderia madseniana]
MGVGSLTAYKPWRTINNSGVKGTAGCVHGIRIDRRYEILDERARIYFFLLERVLEIVDIRESWPILDINGTVRLCCQFDVTHSKHDIFPEPICVDFLLTERGPDGLKFRAVALSADSRRMSARNQRLKQVARQWCNDHGIGWSLVDTSKLDRTVLDSLRFIRGWYRHRYVPDPQVADTFAKFFMDHYQNNLVLDELVESVRKVLRIPPDTALDIFRYCAWSHRIPLSLTGRIAKNCPVILRGQ